MYLIYLRADLISGQGEISISFQNNLYLFYVQFHNF